MFKRIKILINVVIYDMGIGYYILGIRFNLGGCDNKRILICYYQKFIIMSIFMFGMRFTKMVSSLMYHITRLFFNF